MIICLSFVIERIERTFQNEIVLTHTSLLHPCGWVCAQFEVAHTAKCHQQQQQQQRQQQQQQQQQDYGHSHLNVLPMEIEKMKIQFLNHEN